MSFVDLCYSINHCGKGAVIIGLGLEQCSAPLEPTEGVAVVSWMKN